MKLLLTQISTKLKVKLKLSLAMNFDQCRKVLGGNILDILKDFTMCCWVVGYINLFKCQS